MKIPLSETSENEPMPDNETPKVEKAEGHRQETGFTDAQQAALYYARKRRRARAT